MTLPPSPPGRQYRRWWLIIGPAVHAIAQGPLGRAWRHLLGPAHGRYIAPRLCGRKIQPVALGVSLYTAMLAGAILTESAIGQLLAGPIGTAVGLVCAAATGALWVGWWAQSHDWLARGLLWATAGIVATASTVIIDVGWASVSAWLSVPVAVISCGSWLLERADPQGRV